jgi:hypothetical protein
MGPIAAFLTPKSRRGDVVRGVIGVGPRQQIDFSEPLPNFCLDLRLKRAFLALK